MAELLGHPIGSNYTTIPNANDIEKNGIYRLYSTIVEKNNVPEAGWSFLLIVLSANWIKAQLAIGQNKVCYRCKLDDTTYWDSITWKILGNNG